MEAAKNDIIGEILDEKEYALPHNIIPSKALRTKEQQLHTTKQDVILLLLCLFTIVRIQTASDTVGPILIRPVTVQLISFSVVFLQFLFLHLCKNSMLGMPWSLGRKL